MVKTNKPVDAFGNEADLNTSSHLFVSAEATGTAAPQNIAHPFNEVPSIVLAFITEIPGGGAVVDIAYGTHTKTNIVLTVTADVKFIVLALV
jgi:hypothetical protein